jgi:hypothetical protein
MQCLVEIARVHYDYLESHIEKILLMTEHAVINILN